MNRAKNLRLPDIFISWGIPAVIITSYFVLSFQPDLPLSIPVLMTITANIVVFLSIALYLCENKGANWSPLAIIITALLLRLPFLFRPPDLSDDIYRYLWDGLTLLNGNNPYSIAPAEAKPYNEESADILELVNHQHLVTIYPPSAQIIFAAGAFLKSGVFGLKALLAAMDLLVCAVILKILSSMKLPPSRAIIYAWHPLPILEIAGSGHIDGAGMLFLLIAITLLNPRQDKSLYSIFAGLSFSFAILVKLFPLVFLPALLIFINSKNRLPFIIGITGGVTVLSIPFLPDLYNMLVTLSIYANNWEFSGFAYQTMSGITASGNTARQALAFLFFSVLIFSCLMLYVRIKGLNRADSLSYTIKTLYYITIAFLFFTPTLHPWYALYLSCLLPFNAGAAGLVLTWAVFLSYRVLISYAIIGQWIEGDYVPAMIWSGAALAFLITVFARKYREQRHDF